MTYQLIDSHTHLHLSAYDSDREDVLASMERDSVGAITVGTNQRTSQQAIELAERSNRIFATVAYHP